MLKWTASAFAMAAAMQFGLASGQEPEQNATLTPPGPAASDDAADEAQDATKDAADEAQDAADDAQDAQQDAAEDTRENLQDARDDVQDARDDATDDLNGGVQREARFSPNANDAQLNDRIRAATANLNIDDETRARYRWRNGEWWFKTKSGHWKFYRDGQWQDFDPTTYRPMNSGGYGQASGNFVPQGDTRYVQPQQMSGTSGYYYQSRPYSVRRYSGYAPMNRYYNNGWNNGYYNNGWNNGWNNGYYNSYGTGYNPGNDRYYGYGPYGQPYSISGDRYRGGVIGSQIGGQLGGQTGAIIGGAIGANAAD